MSDADKRRKGKGADHLDILYRRGLVWLCVLGMMGWVACLERELPPAAPAPSTSTLAAPIIGGTKDISHPAVGALVIGTRSFCTGTLIASRVVLTAAHCIDSARTNGARGGLRFRIDVPDANQPEGYDTKYYDIEVSLLSNHPKWNNQVSQGFDVGIAILKTKVPDTVAKTIPHNITPLNAQWKGKEPLFLGYGLTQSVPNAVSAVSKQGATIPIIQVLNDRIEHRAPGKSVCHGDSGGPALFTINGQLRVIAVNSYVTGQRVPNANPPRSACDASGVSMRTDTYQTYINSILIKYGDGPASCQQDQDCGSCASCGSKNVCEPKSFPTDSTSCQDCKSDSDCNGGICYRFATGYRCLQPCTNDGCCPQDSVCTPLTTGASNWHCVPKDGACGPLSCQGNDDCGPGEACNQGSCEPVLPPRSPKLCASCQSVYDCDSPKHLCYGPSNNKQCYQPCGAGDFCPKDFSCKLLYPGSPKQCVPDNGTCSILCAADAQCPSGYSCQQGVCGRKGGGEEGDSCEVTKCKEGLDCVASISGKRCMRACGIPSGNTGSFCTSENKCNDSSTCYAFSESFRACLNSCRSDADCSGQGGGRCFQGVCFCQQASDCQQGFVCDTTLQYFGACVKAGNNRPCPNDGECRLFEGGPYCVPKGAGVRGLGEDCDSLNRCKEGLVCIGTDSGASCVEECTQTRRCQLGGQCLQYGRSLSICMCSGTNCPQGRVCRTLTQGYGVCEEQGREASRCFADADCPPEHKCEQAACVPLPLQPKEPATEPLAEPPASDAAPEPAPEPPAPDVTEPPAPDAPATTEPAPDRTSIPTPDAGLKPPGGCGCNTQSTEGPIHPLGWWLLLLIPVALRRKRRESAA